jgi:hypothetical protein
MPVALRVRSHETLERDGRSVRALRVFCPRHHASIDVSACTACRFASVVSETAVTCAPPGVVEEADPAPDPPLFLGPDARSLHTPVGAICAPHSVAVRVDMPIVRFVPVIGDGRRFAGLVSDIDVLRWAARQHNRSELSAARARDVLSKEPQQGEPTS